MNRPWQQRKSKVYPFQRSLPAEKQETTAEANLLWEFQQEIKKKYFFSLGKWDGGEQESYGLEILPQSNRHTLHVGESAKRKRKLYSFSFVPLLPQNLGVYFNDFMIVLWECVQFSGMKSDINGMCWSDLDATIDDDHLA